MDFENKAPDWSAQGTEPPASLKAKGFEAGYKPPAAYFNWFWYVVSKCLAELQSKLSTISESVRSVITGGTGKNAVTAGSYLVGNGTEPMNEKTPAEVLAHIGAAPKNAAIPTVPATSEDGIIYTATVDGVTELYNGLIITIIPSMNSASTAIKLNVNGLGEKMVRVALSFNNAAMTTPRLDTYYAEGRPLTLQYDGEYLNGDGIWKTLGKERTSAQDLYGTVPIESGGTDAANAADARKNLDVLASSEIPNVLTQTVTLLSANWVESGELYEQNVEVTGITADQTKTSAIVSPPTDREKEEAYMDAEVRASSQDDGIITFTATDIPDVDLTASVMVVVLGVRS